jgi:hypothetical protein
VLSNQLISNWYISLIQARNNRQRSAIDQAGSNLMLVGNYKPNPAASARNLRAHPLVCRMAPDAGRSSYQNRRSRKPRVRDCLVHVLKGLGGYGRNHLLQRNFVFHGVSTAKAIKGALQIPEFVGSKRPISAPRGGPQSDMTGLNCCYHEIANTRKIAHCIQGRRGARSRGRRLRQ